MAWLAQPSAFDHLALTPGVYAYNSPGHSAPLSQNVSERGPPPFGNGYTNSYVDDRGPRDSSTRPKGLAPGAIHDGTKPFMQVDMIPETTNEFRRWRSRGAPSAFEPGRVAAKDGYVRVRPGSCATAEGST